MKDRRLLWLGIVLILLITGAMASFLLDRPKSAGVSTQTLSVTSDPRQTNISDPLPIPYHSKKAELQLWPRARYVIDGMVVTSDKYRFDTGAAIAPRDLSLAWGQVPKYRSLISFSHGHRFYSFNYSNKGPFDLRYIEKHSANLHLVPASENLRKAIMRVGNHQTIRLTGFLVDATGTIRKQRFTWKTSMTRDDTGDGACELMYVQEMVWEGKVYR